MENENLNTSVIDDAIVTNENKVANYIERLKTEQNLLGGLASCVITAVLSAIIWALITVVTNYQIGYMAVGVGFLVGYSNRRFGKGIDQVFGIIGAIFALLGCVLGNLFSVLALVANQENLGYLEILLRLDLTAIPAILQETFNFMDIVFYAIAIYEGYKFSFRVITEEELMAVS